MAPTFTSEERLITEPDGDRDANHLRVPTEHNDESIRPVPQIGKGPQHRSRLQAIGRLNITTLTIGLVLCLGVVAYIAFLWLSSPACGVSEPGEVWKAIALSNNFGISITISSVIVRLAMALQLGVAFSVVGALVLENGVAPIQSVPFILTMRGSGKVSVVELAQLVSQTSGTNDLLNLITVVLVLTTALSQFTSTLLLTDLGTSPFLNKTQTALVNYGLKETSPDVGDLEGYQAASDDVDFWSSGATEYPVFAEYSEPRPPQDNQSTQDTGLTLRAFPPFKTTAERASLYRWDGLTAAFDTRVTCLTPRVKANLSIDATEWEWVDGWTSKIEITGYADLELPQHMAWSDVNPDSGPTNQSTRARFKCPVSLPSLTFASRSTSEWAITICELGSTEDTSLIHFFTESPLQPDSKWTAGIQYIVFNTTGTRQDWLEGSGSTNRSTENWHILVISNLTETSDSPAPWTRLSVAGDSSLSIMLSVCVTPYIYGRNMPVNMTRSGPPAPEAVLRRYDRGPYFGMSEIVSLHAGAAKGLTDAERGILTLHKRENWTADLVDARHFAEKATDILWRGNMPVVRNGSAVGVMLCRFCLNLDSRTIFRAHQSHIMVFQQVLRQTGSLAYAIQALFTILLQRGWYDYIDEFDVWAEASYTMYTSNSLIPVRMVGMPVVMATILAHNIVVLTVVIMFLRPQRISVVGNLWQGFGQVVTSNKMAWLAERYTTALDKEVAKDLKDQGIRDEVVGLVHDTDKGVMSLRRRPERDWKREKSAYQRL
ncbi:hypothetical protein V8F20_006361 [Naviculisporaceae sp. PSN 640]